MASTATAAFFEIPTSSSAQSFSITINGTSYIMYLIYRDSDMAGWTLDIQDSSGVNLVCGVPLVTGHNLLEQYAYLGMNATLITGTDGDILAPPTYDNLGTLGHLWFGVRNA